LCFYLNNYVIAGSIKILLQNKAKKLIIVNQITTVAEKDLKNE